MCCSRQFELSRWDEILPEAILYFNNTKNASTQFSPFQVAYGISANLPIDNKMKVKEVSQLDQELIRKNIVANRAEARNTYQKQANSKTVINDFKVGDMVLLKRTHGSFPKMNPLWVSPFEVIKKVGPVN